MSTGTPNSKPIKSSLPWKRNLFSLCLAQFVSIIGMSFFLPFIPLFLKELGMESQSDISTWSGMLFAAGFLMLSLAAPVWGMLADRFGRKPMVMRAMLGGSLVLFLSTFVQTPNQLLFLRLIHGCLGGFVSSAIALIAAETPKKSLGLALGLLQSAITAGFIIGPFFGGFLQDNFGIRQAILIGSGLIFLGALLVFLLVKETNRPEPNEKKFTVWQNAAFLFGHDTLLPAARIQFLSNLSLMLVIPLLALFVEQLLKGDISNIGTLTGIVISSSALSMMIGAPFWGRKADQWGQQKVLKFCLIAAGISFIPQGLSNSLTALILSRVLLGFFAAGIAPSLQALIANHTPSERKAGVLGVSFSVTLMGNAVGPLLGGTLGAALGLRAPFFITMVLLFISGWMSRSLKIKLLKSPTTTLTHSD